MKKESNTEEHVFLKAPNKEDYDKVSSLTYKKMFKLSVKLSKENEKLERSILELKDYINFKENSDKVLENEIVEIIRQSVKCETHVSWKNKVDNMHETLGKFTKGKENLDLILPNQRTSYNKNRL